ncbi:MAG: adenosylcobalamin-dependent ribonucleoside-diphosphate reductase, partial [Deltaproteobacteria bacterium]
SALRSDAPNSPQWFNTGLYYAYGINGPAQGHSYVDPKTGKLKASENAYEHPQPHACFIQSVKDDLVNEDGVMDLWIREARLFKYGSGTGTNFSLIRGEGEKLTGGGKSSGLMSFLKIGDRAAGAIKSGGTTRRAAKMVCLDLDHPEIENFIDWKVIEEQKVAALVAGSKVIKECLSRVHQACFQKEGIEIDVSKNGELKKAIKAARKVKIPDSAIARILQLAQQGETRIEFPEYDVDWQNEAYATVSGQNSNNSVRVSNDFFEKLENDGTWSLRQRTNKKIAKEIRAKELWGRIASATWSSADPGLQYDTTINEWHTCPAEGRINASNPCSEYMFLDDTACNLASLNLIKFYRDDSDQFDVESFRHACRLWTIVLEISVLMAQYPSRAIAQNSYDYRTLGLGYANLGALLMSMGLPYGSPKSLSMTAALTSILTGEAYATSAEMAQYLGAFSKYKPNRESMLRVIRNHRRAAMGAKAKDYEGLSVTPTPIQWELIPTELQQASQKVWNEALNLGTEFGFRNAQVSVIAPTGTIGLIMDCDTTGIEPDFSLVKFKKLAGGGYFRIINQSVPRALKNLGYGPKEVEAIVKYCVGHLSLKQSPVIHEESLRKKGFNAEQLDRIEKAIESGFDLQYVITPYVIGEDFCRSQLGVKGTELDDPSFVLLTKMGFSPQEIEEANRFVFGSMTIEGAPFLKEEHHPIFDCANKCGKYGQRFLAATTHIDTMAAAQPFISGAISKTINMPNEATVDEIADVYLVSWKKMLKAISIYRDGSKLSQPLNVQMASNIFSHLEEDEDELEPTEMNRSDIKEIAEKIVRRSIRRELPKKRFGYTVKATIGGQRVYLRTGEYEDGTLGEIFVDMYKEGAAYRSLMNAFAISVSLGLQYGVPLEEYVNKFNLFRFEPNGHVSDHDNIKFCSSIIDFIFRDIAMNYLGRTDLVHVPPQEELAVSYNSAASLSTSIASSGGMAMVAESSGGQMTIHSETDMVITNEEWSDDLALASRLAKTKGYEGDPCGECGQFTLVRGGTCLRCVSCGSTSGCS